MCAATVKSEEIYQLLKNFEFWKVLQIIPWIYRFLENCKCKEKLSGPVETKEAKKKKKKSKIIWEKTWIRKSCNNRQLYRRLRLTTHLICRWRVQGHYPIYIPRESLLTEKIKYEVDKAWGVILTMSTIRENYCISNLQHIAKKIIRK